MRSIFTDMVGKRVYLEAGSRFAEVGVIREEYWVDDGYAVAILDDCRRVHDETTKGGASFLLEATDGIRIPSTAINLIQLAEERWPGV